MEEPRLRVVEIGRNFIRYRLLDFYPASLEKAVEVVNFRHGWKLFLARKKGNWYVKRWRFPLPQTVLKVEGEFVEVRGREGAEVFDEYCRRVRRQAPLRQLIRDFLLSRLMEREDIFEEGEG